MDTGLSAGLNLFLVEERTVVAIDLECVLEDLGHRVVGVAASVGQALDRLEGASEPVDGVLLCPRLVGQSARPLAVRLARLGIPFVILSDLPEGDLRRLGFRAPRLAAPAQPAAVSRALRDLATIAPRRTAVPA